jgi:hypothetical protein
LFPSFIVEGNVKAGLMESRKATGTPAFSNNPRRHPSARCAKQNARTHVHGYPPVAAARQSAQTWPKVRGMNGKGMKTKSRHSSSDYSSSQSQRRKYTIGFTRLSAIRYLLLVIALARALREFRELTRISKSAER